MRESGYYPPGAEFDPNAPYNQVENPEKEFNITVSQTLSKTVTVVTTDYNYCEDNDEEGCSIDYDTSDTDWKQVYEDNGHTPLQLIKILKMVLEENKANGIVFKTPGFTDDLITECEDWCEDELVFVEE